MKYPAAVLTGRPRTTRQREKSSACGIHWRMTCCVLHLNHQHHPEMFALFAKNMLNVGALDVTALCFVKLLSRRYRTSCHLLWKWNLTYLWYIFYKRKGIEKWLKAMCGISWCIIECCTIFLYVHSYKMYFKWCTGHLSALKCWCWWSDCKYIYIYLCPFFGGPAVKF